MESNLSLVDTAAQALHISVEVLPPDLTIEAEVNITFMIDIFNRNPSHNVL